MHTSILVCAMLGPTQWDGWVWCGLGTQGSLRQQASQGAQTLFPSTLSLGRGTLNHDAHQPLKSGECSNGSLLFRRILLLVPLYSPCCFKPQLFLLLLPAPCSSVSRVGMGQGPRTPGGGWSAMASGTLLPSVLLSCRGNLNRGACQPFRPRESSSSSPSIWQDSRSGSFILQLLF